MKILPELLKEKTVVKSVFKQDQEDKLNKS